MNATKLALANKKTHHLQLVLIFILVAICFFAYRSTQGLVWNDSPQTVENLYGYQEQFSKPFDTAIPVCRDEGAFDLHWRTPGVLKTILIRAFNCIEFGGYRPLSAVISLTGVAIFSDVYSSTEPNLYLEQLWIAIVAVLFGILAVLLFAISRKYVETNLAAYLILIFFFFSPPMVSGGWILFSGGIQVTVPLFICLGLWLYHKTASAVRLKGCWVLALVIVLLIGPWVREYIGIVAGLIIYLEVKKHLRVTGLFMLALLGFLHALFPTALLHLFLPQLPLVSVFKLGSLAVQLNAVSGGYLTIWDSLAQVKWEVGKIFLVVLPPSFFLISGLIALASIKRHATNLTLFALLLTLWIISFSKPWFWFLLILSFCAITLVLARNQGNGCRFQKVLFLNIWFLLSLLPFLKVFSSHVHLAYPLIPATILIVSVTEGFWIDICRRHDAIWKKVIIISILVAGVLDQVLNAYASYVTVNSLNGGIQFMADWMRTNTPRGTIVIANALHAEDIRLYSKNHISPYWSVGVGVPQERTLDKPKDLEKFLHKHFGGERILMLNMEQHFSLVKGDFHAHKYITRNSVKVKYLGKIYSFDENLLFVDPLRNFLPREMVLFLGPPDLENDIYFGRNLSRRPFLNTIAVTYKVYEVLAPKVSKAAFYQPNSTFLFPKFLEYYREFQLVAYREKILAVPYDVLLKENRLDPEADPRIILSNSLEEIKTRVDQYLTQQRTINKKEF